MAGREYYAEGSSRPLDYKGKRVMLMSAYEIISIIIQFMNCLLIVLIALVSVMKK